jgi:hypothetical protein
MYHLLSNPYPARDGTSRLEQSKLLTPDAVLTGPG